jgi:phage terminase small subunit
MPKIRSNDVGLTPRQERFVVEYCLDRNGQRAAIAAGYAPKAAGITASKLLTKPKIIAAILGVNKRDDKKLELTRERVLAELAKGLFRDPVGLQDADGFVVTDLRQVPPELRTIIDGFEVTQDLERDEDGVLQPVRQKIKVKLVPKASMVDMGMKHLGAYAAEKQVMRVGIDWDELYRRQGIMDPVEEAIKKIQADKSAED